MDVVPTHVKQAGGEKERKRDIERERERERERGSYANFRWRRKVISYLHLSKRPSFRSPWCVDPLRLLLFKLLVHLSEMGEGLKRAELSDCSTLRFCKRPLESPCNLKLLSNSLGCRLAE